MSAFEVNEASEAPAAGPGRPPTGREANVTHELPDWWADCERELHRLPSLPENWDSYGAAPPERENVEAAVLLLRKLLVQLPLMQPWVSANRNGGVFMEWKNGRHELELDVASPTSATFLYENTETEEMICHENVRDLACDPGFREILAAHFATTA